MSKARKKSEIMVNVVDLSALEDDASEHIQETDPRDDHLDMSTHHKWGYVETPAGIYVLCDEGVGDSKPVTADNKVRFEFTRAFKTENGKSFSVVPCLAISLDDQEVKELSVVQRIPLHEFIRTFGNRLEANYRTWVTFFSSISTNCTNNK